MIDAPYQVAAFYRFTIIADVHGLRRDIRALGDTLDTLCGTILLAPEGVNGTIAASPGQLEILIRYLDEQLGICSGELKYSHASKKPFNRFKVRPKKEIITMGQPKADPNILCGEYVEAADWNALISDPDVTLIDTRNIYETEIGIFKGAQDPMLNVFSEFPDWVGNNMDPARHKKIAMFCTGGIRCEKASAYMKAQGFENVYHLKGGILKYLETVPREQSLWEGECFVFDQRVTVGHGLKEGSFSICHGCREPLSAEELQHPSYEKGVSCPHCRGDLTSERAARLRIRHKHYADRVKSEML